MRKEDIKKENRGSAVVEITLLLPIFLGVCYLYIMFFLAVVRCGALMEQGGGILYVEKNHLNTSFPGDSFKQGEQMIVSVFERDRAFSIHFIMKKSDGNPVKKLRRWQIATDSIS